MWIYSDDDIRCSTWLENNNINIKSKTILYYLESNFKTPSQSFGGFLIKLLQRSI